MRIDLLLVQLGLAPSRTKAQELIHHGDVEIEERGQWKVVHQPSLKVGHLSQHQVRLRSDDLLQFVSRGGHKLRAAIDHIGLDVHDRTIFDVGISTGGFADCLLQRGAKKIVGVDVGTGQLAEKLKNDKRVISFEQINARDLRSQSDIVKHVSDVNLCVVDVSFISLSLILPEIAAVLPHHELLALIKPQFELSPDALDKEGIVTSIVDREKAQTKVRQCAEHCGYQILEIFPAAIKGGDGNQEFFLYAKR